MEQWFWDRGDGAQEGPVDLLTLRQRLAELEGPAADTAEVFCESLQSWRSARSDPAVVLEQMRQLAAGVALAEQLIVETGLKYKAAQDEAKSAWEAQAELTQEEIAVLRRSNQVLAATNTDLNARQGSLEQEQKALQAQLVEQQRLTEQQLNAMKAELRMAAQQKQEIEAAYEKERSAREQAQTRCEAEQRQVALAHTLLDRYKSEQTVRSDEKLTAALVLAADVEAKLKEEKQCRANDALLYNEQKAQLSSLKQQVLQLTQTISGLEAEKQRSKETEANAIKQRQQMHVPLAPTADAPHEESKSPARAAATLNKSTQPKVQTATDPPATPVRTGTAESKATDPSVLYSLSTPQQMIEILSVDKQRWVELSLNQLGDGSFCLRWSLLLGTRGSKSQDVAISSKCKLERGIQLTGSEFRNKAEGFTFTPAADLGKKPMYFVCKTENEAVKWRTSLNSIIKAPLKPTTA